MSMDSRTSQQKDKVSSLRKSFYFLTILVAFLTRLTESIPISQTASQVCDTSGWYHGYQSVGLIYTVGDTNPNGVIVIGGSLSSGCSILQPPSTNYLNDKCVVIEQFSSYTDTSPVSVIIGKTVDGFGIDSILALKVSYDASATESNYFTSVFGVLKLAAGQTIGSLTTVGTEIVFLSLTYSSGAAVNLYTFYISSLFSGYSCNLSQKNVDYLGETNQAFITFSNCNSPYENYILVVDVQNQNIKSLTKFDQASVQKWYVVKGNSIGAYDAIFAGLNPNYSQTQSDNSVLPFPAIVWLTIRSTNINDSTIVQSPTCKFEMIMDTQWISQFGSNLYIPAAVGTSPNSIPGPSLIALHSSTTFGSVILIATRQNLCSDGNFDIAQFNNAGNTLQLEIIQLQLYGSAADTKLKMLLLDHLNNKYILVDQMIVWDGGSSDANHFYGQTSQQISWLIQSTNYALNLGQSNFNYFLLPQTASNPIALGSSSLYYSGVTDGFMLRDQGANTCLEYILDSTVVTIQINGTVQIGYFQSSNTSSCDTTPLVSTDITASNTYSNVSAISLNFWSSQNNFITINPCLLRNMADFKGGFWYSQTCLFCGSYSQRANITQRDLCPFADSSTYIYDLKVDTSNQTVNPGILMSYYTNSNPYSTQIFWPNLTNISLTTPTNNTYYPIPLRYGIYGDFSVSSLTQKNNYTLRIEYCNHDSWNYTVLNRNYCYKIGSTTNYTWFYGSGCNYTTNPKPTSYWTSISSYTYEQYNKVGWSINGTMIQQPYLQITEPNVANVGVQTYTVEVTDYLDVVHQTVATFNFCELVTSSQQLVYTMSLGDQSPLTIDLSSIQFSSCYYQLQLVNMSGPVDLANKTVLTQPTFSNTADSAIYTSTNGGSISITAPEVTEKSYIGSYSFSLIIFDGNTGWIPYGNSVFNPYEILNFTLNVNNCITIWNTAQTLTPQTYILNTTGILYQIPSFVSFYCNPVTTSFTVAPIGWPLTSDLTQLSTSSGSSQISVYSTSWLQIGNYTLSIICQDSTTAVYSPAQTLVITVQPDCYTAWIPNLVIANQTYALSSSIPLSTPSFSSNACHQLVTTFSVNRTTFQSLMALTQTNQKKGDSNIAVSTLMTDRQYLGWFNVTVTCTDLWANTQNIAYFLVNVVPFCFNSWQTAVSVSDVIYKLNDIKSVTIGAFTTTSCNPVVTSFISTPSLGTAATLSQTDGYYGNSVITVQTSSLSNIGNFTINVTCYDADDNQSLSTSFKLQIVNYCDTVWNTILNIAPQIYTLTENNGTYIIPTFAAIPCDQLILSYTILQGNPKIKQYLNFTQTDDYLGSSQLQLYSADQSLRGIYQIQIECFDNYTLAIVKNQLNLTINDRCDFNTFTTFPQSDQTVFGNKAFYIIWQPFNQSLQECGDITYFVNFTTILGKVTSSWFTTDSSNYRFSMDPGLNIIKQISIVNITVTGVIKSLLWQPSAQINFLLTVMPETSISNLQSQTNNTEKKSQQNSIVITQTEIKPEVAASQAMNGQPLSCQITSMTNTGQVRILFNQPLIIPVQFQNVTGRRKKNNYTETIDQVIQIKVISGQQKVDLNRTKIVRYNLTDFKKSAIFLQVDFLNPNELSITTHQVDILQVTFIQNSIFITENQRYLDPDTVISYTIPKQLTLAEAQSIQKLENTVESAATFLASVNLVVNIVLSFGLKYLWNFVNILQFLVFMTRWNLNYPDNALAFLKYLKSIALMEFLPIQKIQDKICQVLHIDPSDPSNIVTNMGVMLLIGILLFVVLVALLIASVLVNTSYKHYKTYRQIKGSIFYNAFLRYILQSSLKMGIAAGVSLSVVNWSNISVGTLATPLIILTFIALSPAYFYLILRNNYNSLPKPSMVKKIGSLYLALKDKEKWALAYSPIFMMRRIIFIAITFGLANFATFQVLALIIITVLYKIYLGLVVPHSLQFMTKSEFINEIVLLLISYHTLMFTDIISEKGLRTKLGWSVVGLIGILFLINFSLIIGVNIQVIQRWYFLRKLKQTTLKSRENLFKNKKQGQNQQSVGNLAQTNKLLLQFNLLQHNIENGLQLPNQNQIVQELYNRSQSGSIADTSLDGFIKDVTTINAKTKNGFFNLNQPTNLSKNSRNTTLSVPETSQADIIRQQLRARAETALIKLKPQKNNYLIHYPNHQLFPTDN